jgi:hypothetical protein
MVLVARLERDLRLAERELECAGTLVKDVVPAAAGEAGDEAVVELEAPRAEIAQLRLMPFDVWRQDAGRRAWRPAARVSRPDSGAGFASQAIVQDDTGADDDDSRRFTTTAQCRR